MNTRKEPVPALPKDPDIEAWIDRILREDIGPGDATTEALVPADARASARVLARERCIGAGIPLARRIFERLDPGVRFSACAPDGAGIEPGGTLLHAAGRARALLTAERTALNILQRLCGIATLTRAYVDAAGGGLAVLDTRKTTPGLRHLEKYAVRCGGGSNHRTGLYDRILIKDNHRAFWARGRTASLADAVRAARASRPDLQIEIEVESEAELIDALDGAPDWVLLDNMTPKAIRLCVARCAGRARVEVSGGITLETLPAMAGTGADAVSVGALTHSAPAVDLSMEFD